MLGFHLTWYCKCEGFPSTISMTRTASGSVWVLTEYYLEGGVVLGYDFGRRSTGLFIATRQGGGCIGRNVGWLL
jgi:hypothetical protein